MQGAVAVNTVLADDIAVGSGLLGVDENENRERNQSGNKRIMVKVLPAIA